MGILNKIRQKPDNEKRLISFIMATVLTLVIVVFWFSFTASTAGNQISEKDQDKLSSVSPMQVIKDEFSKALSGFDTQIHSGSSSTIPVEVIPENLSSSTENISTSSPQASTTNIN